jgi:hypothetical protein
MQVLFVASHDKRQTCSMTRTTYLRKKISTMQFAQQYALARKWGCRSSRAAWRAGHKGVTAPVATRGSQFQWPQGSHSSSGLSARSGHEKTRLTRCCAQDSGNIREVTHSHVQLRGGVHVEFT